MNLKRYAIAATFLIFSGHTMAGVCGIGRVLEISEGWGGQENLMIKLDYGVPGSLQPPTTKILIDDALDAGTQWFKFNESNDILGPDRLKRIRTLAYLALANGNTVKLISQWDGDQSCQNLHQINIISTISIPDLPF